MFRCNANLYAQTAAGGANYSYMASVAVCGDLANQVIPMKVTRISQPSERISIFENAVGANLAAAPDGSGDKYAYNWHGHDHGNYLMVDGSVQSIVDPAFSAPMAGRSSTVDASTTTKTYWFRNVDR